MQRHVFGLLLSSALALGCAPNTGGPRRDSGMGGGFDSGTTSQTDGGGTTTRDSGRPPIEECAREVTMAETRPRPVDIVWIIDNSGSMSGEAASFRTTSTRSPQRSDRPESTTTSS